MNIKEKFTGIYKNNEWGCSESRSGGGSTVKRTTELRKWLTEMIAKYNIQSMVDAPCGDFNWMKEVQFPRNFIYIGVDIVDEMIRLNKQKYRKELKTFLVRDITSETFPKTNMIFCRDLFLHLSFEDIWKVINNFKDSGAEYLIVSNYMSCKTNKEQKTGGQWRPVNLQITPFDFPPPIEILDSKDTPMAMFIMDAI